MNLFQKGSQNQKMPVKKKTLKQAYIDGWNYLKESKRFIFIIALLFLIFVLIGFIIPAPESVTQRILTLIEEILEKTEGMGLIELIWFIFWNNLRVSFIGMISGILFGILPLLTCISNGYLLGFVSSFVASQDGFTSLWRVFPHGIFELPAVFISLGLGLLIGYWAIIFIYKFIKYHKKTVPLWLLIILLILSPPIFLFITLIIDFFHSKRFSKEIYSSIHKSLRTFFLIILPLLIIAAVIESIFIFIIS